MWKHIFKTTIIAGALDITAASMQAYLVKGLTPDVVLTFIASGLFGKEAYVGGPEFLLVGLLVHLFIVFMITISYFYLYPKIHLLHRNILLSAFVIAFTSWLVTTQIIIPLSQIQPAIFNLKKVLTAIAILYFCIGMPIAFFTKRFYSKSLKHDA